LVGLFVGWRASRALRLSKEEVRTEHDIRVEVRPYLAPANVNFEAVSSPQYYFPNTTIGQLVPRPQRGGR
jgi:hypothetical protein